MAEKLLNVGALAVYREALERVDAATPHCSNGCHGMPSDENLAEITIVENAVDMLLDKIEADDETRRLLRLDSARLWHLILEQQQAIA
jgi:hypothetical protein